MMASPAPCDERWGQSPLAQLVGVKSLMWVFLVALALRGGVAFASIDRFGADPDAYRAIAETLIHHGVFGLAGANDQPQPTAFRPPLYPYVLSWTTTGAGAVAMLHSVLGAITVVTIFAATMTIYEDWMAASVAAIFVAIDPILLQQSTLVMTETLATLLVAIVLWRWCIAIRCGFSIRECVWIGSALAAAYLCRPTFLVWACLVVMSLIAMALSWKMWQSRKTYFRSALIIAAVVAMAVGAWCIRNVRELGHPVWATTHGGYTMLLANNPMFYDYLRDESAVGVWNPQSFFEAYSHRYESDPTRELFWDRDWSIAGPPQYPSGVTEVSDDRLTAMAAKASIRREPLMFAWSCVVRLSRLWSPFPFVTPERSRLATIGVGLYYVVLYAVVLWGGRRILRSDRLASLWIWWPAMAMILTLTAVHAVYWSNMRMRAPAIPGCAMIAAACFARDRRRV